MPLTLLPLPAAEVLLNPDFLAPADAAHYLTDLNAAIAWRQEPIRLFGKEVLQPRLTAWHGDEGAAYQYSGLRLSPAPWTPALQALRQRVEQAAGTSFNSVLLNLYRSGQDSMGWHADDEPELGPEPVIASVSIGSARRFRLRPRPGVGPAHPPLTLELPGGSLLIMRGLTQRNWQHAVPKTAQAVGPRLNLTFRHVIS
ncbi:alpha-ketoglutarate-dependent dioxygenase AlkB [Hymenobacter busanensis]|uniref:Alpha-ketoglutarate-dependent dioxygenase AlkB n=1 Tax=Hymenobacter busanensis TaxID=2607656 RepID=A0A7L4ZZ11_9BACT|nr:alpha-ketoglutarate-dependent dioxygenase AlkB [Hymenobacter busanensis]KAA9331358.1 alpha-ketoglutarate-dependent dioxygenase AlkB [Hymenobacter busanensis]QHJ08511.1 alpha-ketoglutarate-dependent dioxygenase AlkB [Hymenobacter busanensis]